MKYIRKFEKIELPELKKYVLWISHPLSKLYHILEIKRISYEGVYAIFICTLQDNGVYFQKNEKIKEFPLEEFLDENIIKQSNDFNELCDYLKMMGDQNKYNL